MEITALYCRIASSNQRDNDVVENQLKLLRDFASSHGYTNCYEYVDIGYSGNNMVRPSILQLNDDIEAGKIKRVIVRTVDRIARDNFLCSEWVNGIEAKGVEFIAIDGGRPLNMVAS